MSEKNIDSPEAIIEMRTEPDFDIIKNQILELMGTTSDIILATSLDDRVTARTVSFVNNDFDIYFLTWNHNKKVIQLNNNSNVALCLQNVQIEGEAENLGWAFGEKNTSIGELFITKFSQNWWNAFSKIKEMIMIKIKPKSIVRFERINRRFHFQNLDLQNCIVYQMRLEDKDHPNYPY
ncbi:MAG: pyridoxamine 5'-phosphate oxidase family protein [Asgard group archaeon]|nr:pyridoxamine 5'-phosphate oxidase family protein [Asgard group archaeon]